MEREVITPFRLERIIHDGEGENSEFKDRSSFSDSELFDYCAALANEGGGWLVFGVDDKTRKIVGTEIYEGTAQKYPIKILDAIGIRVRVREVNHGNGRVVVFHVPSRSKGIPVQSAGDYRYPMRAGSSLTEMDPATLKAIFREDDYDFSAKTAHGFSLPDIDATAIKNLKALWSKKERKDYSTWPNEKVLRALGLMDDKGLTHAALILLGKEEKLKALLPFCEVIFEWRQDPQKIPYDSRYEWKGPFLSSFEDIWKKINERNLRIPFQEGLIQREVLAFNERAVRESVLNAIAHRDYTITSGSIFIKASGDDFLVVSPGSFLPGITPENVVKRQAWRNRLIAEVLQRLGLVERSGQGMDEIFETTIREGKGLPDLSESDERQVSLRIPARVKDRNFILFLEKVANQKQIHFSFDELYELEVLREKKSVARIEFAGKFLDLGVVEKIGRTSGTKFILSHLYYAYEEKPGLYTKIRGLKREHKKELILDHIRREGKGMKRDFADAFPDLSRKDISNLLQELRQDGKIRYRGSKQGGYWALK